MRVSTPRLRPGACPLARRRWSAGHRVFLPGVPGPGQCPSRPPTRTPTHTHTHTRHGPHQCTNAVWRLHGRGRASTGHWSPNTCSEAVRVTQVPVAGRLSVGSRGPGEGCSGGFGSDDRRHRVCAGHMRFAGVLRCCSSPSAGDRPAADASQAPPMSLPRSEHPPVNAGHSHFNITPDPSGKSGTCVRCVTRAHTHTRTTRRTGPSKRRWVLHSCQAARTVTEKS